MLSLDFNDNRTSESWYDLREDWGLVEASLAKQYGLRIRQHTDMPWTEFCTLVGGLMPDTPLGQIVSIRAEKDEETVKRFTPDQKRIRQEWANRKASKLLENPDELQKSMDDLNALIKSMFAK